MNFSSVLMSLRWFLLGVAAVLAMLALSLPSGMRLTSLAADNPPCMDSDYGAILAQEFGGQNISDSRGTRSDVRIVSTGAACQKVSSVYVHDGQGGFEFGYLIGYSNCPGHRGVFFQRPTLFYYGVLSSGSAYTCDVFENRHPPEATYQTFRASDLDSNGYWGAWYNGEELTPNGISLDFVNGRNSWGMERGGHNDSGYSRFNNLNEWHPGNDWSRWEAQGTVSDTDPDYSRHEPNEYTGITRIN